MSNQTLKNKVIWITGANRGIGASIAKKLAEQNATLILSSSSEKTMEKIIPFFAETQDILFLPCDISSVIEVEKTYNKIETTLGAVDILINNAGIAKFTPFIEMSIEEFDKMNSINYRGTFLCTKAVLPRMIKRKCGTIINILSVVTKKVFQNASIYSASKSAVLSMSRSIREEVRKDGIKVVNVFPGATETDIWDDAMREEFKEIMMQPEDVADAVSSIINLSTNERLMIEEIVLRPQNGDI